MSSTPTARDWCLAICVLGGPAAFGLILGMLMDEEKKKEAARGR